MSEPRVIWLEDDPEAAIHLAIEALTRETVIVFPTDTIYGLLAIGYSKSAYQEIFRIKGRDFNQPLALLIQESDLAFSEVYGAVAGSILVKGDPDAYDDIAGPMFSEGKLTAIIPPTLLTEYTSEIAQIQSGPVGMRLTRHAALRKIIVITGWLWATSVNRSGRPSATTAREVRAWLKEMQDQGIRRPELVVLSRKRGSGKPSSVIDLTGDEPKRLR